VTSSPDRDWLRTPEGREWLNSDEGMEWLRSDEGIAWVDSPDSQEWRDGLVQRGFENFFSGRMPPSPTWAIRPSDAPQIGARVRLTESSTMMGGTTIHRGELAIVYELSLMPAGCVIVRLRTIDGRKMITIRSDVYEPATS
jgi:hypothetical protein